MCGSGLNSLEWHEKFKIFLKFSPFSFDNSGGHSSVVSSQIVKSINEINLLARQFVAT